MLKQLIQRLLDSRTTPAQAGHASKPGSAVPVDYNPSASVDNWGPVLSNSTAVSDGYIWAVGRTTSDKGFFQINTQALQITTTGTSNPGGEILNLFTPVSKGQRFSVYGRYLEQITVRLVKTIGGGYNIFVRRVLSCLKPLSNFSQKVSSRANQIGLAAKFFRSQESLSTLPLKRTQRRAMGGLSSGDFLPTFWRLMSQAEDLCSYPVLCRNTKAKGLQFLFISRSLRDRKSTCWETKPQTFCNVGLLQPLALRNLLSTGGKLC